MFEFIKKNKISSKDEIKEQSNTIFEFMNPDENNSLSKMSGIDLQELLFYIENYDLILRNNLGLKKNIRFRTELEFEQANTTRLKEQLEKEQLMFGWKMKQDGSLYKGGEINSPLLRDEYFYWEDLQKVCFIISKNAMIGKHCGGHIHVGTQTLGSEATSWLNFIKIWSAYENIIFRFLYGNFLNARNSIKKYAEPLSEVFWQDYLELKKNNQLDTKEIIRQINHQRNQAINFKNITELDKFKFKNTIEFRCPNGTLDPVIWQNNINLLIKILEYSKNSTYDDDLIQNRRKINKDIYSNLYWYSEIYLQQALELSDMIFTKNIDKIYFLRQYLKSFQINNYEFKKTKPFTKNRKIV